MTREELQQLSSEDFKTFFVETLAESRDLAKTCNDLLAKSLSTKVTKEQISRDKAEEVILAVVEYNKRAGAFLKQFDPSETIGSSDDIGDMLFDPTIGPALPPWW